MGLKTIRAPQVVEEVNYGLYVWKMPDGRWVGDEDGNFLCIESEKGDPRKMARLQEVVRSYGIEEGAAHFLSGHRKITDEEYAEQKARLSLGYLPDEYDIPALIEEQRNKNGN